jgi:DNA polymerase-3 subunit beta
MKVTLNTHLLRDSIGKVLSVIDRKNTRPILSYSLFWAHDDHIELMATDLEMSAKVIVEANVENSGKFCINAKNIFEILKELPDAEIHLSLDEKNNLLKLNCGKINYSLVICSAEDFPNLNFQSGEAPFQISKETLQEIFSKTSHAISNDETRQYMNGIFFQSKDDKLRAVATDGYRMALIDKDTNFNNNNHLSTGIIIPRKGITEIRKIVDHVKSDSLFISVDDSFIYLNAENTYFLTVRLISRDFPKYEAVIPQTTAYRLNINREKLLNAVKRMKILANEKSNGLRFNFKNQDLTISANHPSLGDAVETISVNYPGEELDIGLNAKYLIDTFSTIEDEEIFFEFNNELTPVLIKSQMSPDFLGLIMPLKL